MRQALAGARTAIEAGDLTLAGQRVAEAQGRLGADAATLPDLAAEIGASGARSRPGKPTRIALIGSSRLASDAQDKMSYGEGDGRDRMAGEALGLYGV